MLAANFQVRPWCKADATQRRWVESTPLANPSLSLLSGQVLLYIRFGLRKKLGLTYLDVKGIRRYSSHTTAATEAAPTTTTIADTADGSERSAGTVESTPVEEMSSTKNSQVAPAP